MFVDALALCRWVQERFQDDPRPLPRALCRGALELLDAVSLSLRNRRREEMLERADETLLVLRVHLRLAGELALLQERQVLFALDQADKVGRQIGGWIRSLEPL